MITRNLQQFMMKQAQDTPLPSVSEKKTPEATREYPYTSGEATGPYRYDEHRRRGYDVLNDEMWAAMHRVHEEGKPLQDLKNKYDTERYGSEDVNPWYNDPRFAEARKKQKEELYRYFDVDAMRSAYQGAANERAMLPSDTPPLALQPTIEQDIAAALGPSQPKPQPSVSQPTESPLLERLKRLNRTNMGRNVEDAGKLRIGDIFRNLWYPGK